MTYLDTVTTDELAEYLCSLMADDLAELKAEVEKRLNVSLTVLINGDPVPMAVPIEAYSSSLDKDFTSRLLEEKHGFNAIVWHITRGGGTEFIKRHAPKIINVENLVNKVEHDDSKHIHEVWFEIPETMTFMEFINAATRAGVYFAVVMGYLMHEE